MSVVIGLSFPEEAILVSDSRVSFVNNGKIINKKDDMRKVFVLTPQLAIGFVSNDVGITSKIIAELQKYICKSKNKNTHFLLQRLPKVAKHHYDFLTKGKNTLSEMEFIYAGIVVDRGFTIPELEVMEILLRRGGGAVPEPIGRALMTMSNGMMSFDPPTPVIMTHSFPLNKVSSMDIWSLNAVGSGAEIIETLKDEYSALMMAEPGPQTGFRANLIRILCDEFVKSRGISTIGGAVQVIRISAKGAQGVSSDFKRIFNDGSTQDLSSMSFDGDKWIWNDYENNKSGSIKSYLPPITGNKKNVYEQ